MTVERINITTCQTDAISFFVPGIPVPGGSKKAFIIPGTNRANVVDAAGERNKNWRASVALFAREAFKGEPLTGPLRLHIVFHMPRPKKHYRANGQLRETAPHWHVCKPDTTKLVRACEDALTQILWVDDTQVADQNAKKIYAANCGAYVSVESLAPGVGKAEG